MKVLHPYINYCEAMFPINRIQWILFAVMVHIKWTSSSLSGTWDNDVFIGRHWDDWVTPTTVYSPEVTKPALLVMYEPRCEAEIFEKNFIAERLPLQQYLVFGKYDSITTPKYIWYDIDEHDDILNRYNPQNCPEYLYFAKGSSVFQPEIYQRSSGIEVLDWLWGKFAVAISVENHRNDAVMIDIKGKRPHFFILQAGEIQMFQTFISDVILITDRSNGKFIHGMVIEPETTSLDIKNSMDMGDIGDMSWYTKKKQEMEVLSTKTREKIWKISSNYLRNFKQPLLLPMFTKQGYHKTKIPNSLYQDIMEFYRAGKVNRRHESGFVDPLINDREVRCTMVKLSEEMVDHIAEIIKPLMEAWSNVSLELTYLYGIREYYTGNILRNHVDRVSTHVISAILQIDQEMEGQPAWQLEVITRDGKRRHTSLKPGEMLFYESATIIHGRPMPLQGKIYANAFLHYKPINNWKWHMHPDGHWIMYDGHPKEVIDQLVTKTTEQKPKIYYHEEL